MSKQPARSWPTNISSVRSYNRGKKRSASEFGSVFSSMTSSSTYTSPAPSTTTTSRPRNLPAYKKKKPGIDIDKAILVLPDYVLGDTACALYLSIKYHRLHPKYIHGRIGIIKRMYKSRILLVHVDVDDCEAIIEDITQIAYLNDWVVICVWSYVEGGRYLETFRMYEKKSADLIKAKVDQGDLKECFGSCLGLIRSVNKTDVATLASHFGSFAGIAKASVQQLAACPGIGNTKAERVYKSFRQRLVSSRSFFGGGSSSSSVASIGSTPTTSRRPQTIPSAVASNQLISVTDETNSTGVQLSSTQSPFPSSSSSLSTSTSLSTASSISSSSVSSQSSSTLCQSQSIIPPSSMNRGINGNAKAATASQNTAKTRNDSSVLTAAKTFSYTSLVKNK